jgi:hypothetical protein
MGFVLGFQPHATTRKYGDTDAPQLPPPDELPEEDEVVEPPG